MCGLLFCAQMTPAVVVTQFKTQLVQTRPQWLRIAKSPELCGLIVHERDVLEATSILGRVERCTLVVSNLCNKKYLLVVLPETASSTDFLLFVRDSLHLYSAFVVF
jgi:hypothetical protein